MNSNNINFLYECLHSKQLKRNGREHGRNAIAFIHVRLKNATQIMRLVGFEHLHPRISATLEQEVVVHGLGVNRRKAVPDASKRE